jgi:hypothetical protein
MSKRWVPLVGLAAVVTLGVRCGNQGGNPEAASVMSQEQLNGLEQRVSDIEWWLRRDLAPTATRDSVTESVLQWGKRVAKAVCAIEGVVPGVPTTTMLCPPDGGDGSGDPPPTPPFL